MLDSQYIPAHRREALWLTVATAHAVRVGLIARLTYIGGGCYFLDYVRKGN